MAHRESDYGHQEFDEVTGFSVSYDDASGRWTVEGTCPNCELRTDRSYGMVTTAAAEVPADALPALDMQGKTVTMACDCGKPHKDRPADDVGCGAYWRIKLEPTS